MEIAPPTHNNKWTAAVCHTAKFDCCQILRNDSPPAMAVLPFDVTVTDVVATMYLISAEQISWLMQPLTLNTLSLSSLTFLYDREVDETSWWVFNCQPVPQWEVINGEQVVFVSWSQKISAGSKFSIGTDFAFIFGST